MPPKISEKNHYHQNARQFFFYVLRGSRSIATSFSNLEVEGGGEEIEIAAGIAHRAYNDSSEDVRFLVISNPITKGDRVEI